MPARRTLTALLALLLLAPPAVTAAAPPTPSEFLKKTIGADRTLADWGEIVSYFRALDAASDRVEVSTIGTSTRVEEMILAAISSPENLARKDRIRDRKSTRLNSSHRL